MNEPKSSTKPSITGPYWMQGETDAEAKLMFWYSDTKEYRLLGTEKLRPLPDDGLEFRYKPVESIDLFAEKRIKSPSLVEFLTMEKPRFIFLSGELNCRASTDMDRWYHLAVDGWYYCELNWNRLSQGINVFDGDKLLGKIFEHNTLDDLGQLVDPWRQKLKEEQRKMEKMCPVSAHRP